MLCPSCLTENEEGACVCSHCSSAFPRPDEAETEFAPLLSNRPDPPGTRRTSPPPGPRMPLGASAETPGVDETVGVRQSFSAALVPGTDFGPRYHVESV